MPSANQAVKAIFFDRDGVINDLIFNPKTGEFESPHHLKDLKMISGAAHAMKAAQDKGFEIFIVSNQPSYAKGKTTLEEIKRIALSVMENLEAEGVSVRDSFYCYHHPRGILPEWTMLCECRKPSPFFLKMAAEQYVLDLGSSWMIGDQDTDIECGKLAGCQTILIENPDSEKKRGQKNEQDIAKAKPDHKVKNLAEAVKIILET